MFYETPLKEFEYCCMDYKWIDLGSGLYLCRLRWYGSALKGLHLFFCLCCGCCWSLPPS